jgi:Asp-tRNA(Asn)/Glu-tRNA(Gln) amidotransferase A subunit family amidase
MALSWSMDKIGPIARSVEDCALILDAIHGHDGLDPTAVDRPFAWPPAVDLSRLKIGVLQVDGAPAPERDAARALRALGFETVGVELPRRCPPGAIAMMLGVEAAAAFDGLTRSRNTEGLNEWPETFRQGQFTPAVEYLRAARVRTLLMRDMARLFETVDVLVGGGGDDLAVTNLTGHPSAVFPAGFRDRDGRPAPGSIVLTGRLYDESTLLAVARACQEAAGDHRARPPLEQFLALGEPPAESDPIAARSASE